MVIKSITYFNKVKELDIRFYTDDKNKVVLDFNDNLIDGSFSIKVEFNFEITLIRNHDYEWSDNNEAVICNWYSPKILKLEDGSFVQANTVYGIWEFSPKEKNTIEWHFNPEYSKPITQYCGRDNSRQTIQSTTLNLVEPMSLLISKKNAVEFSRSKIPFTAIACFTDHCDFDTKENLIHQRAFFKNKSIKITKGFFLDDFSNRPNASFSKDANELIKWREDGHELAYHSLSQSIKHTKDSFKSFETFNPPFNDIATWIDHGYQPYNLSLFNNYNKSGKWYETILTNKSISTLWNYADSGTSTYGVINQLNPKQFTLAKYLGGMSGLSLKSKFAAMIKSVMFHYYNDENYVVAYRNIAKYYKLTFIAKNVKYIFKLIWSFLKVILIISRTFFFWAITKNKTFPLAKYSPVIFNHKLNDKIFYIFQTIEMVDFKKSLCKENIDILMRERGLFIAHTYFSVPLSYHEGRLFKTSTEIDDTVNENFEYLGNKIKNDEVWNPTLKELVSYFNLLENLVFDIDSFGIIYLKSRNLVPIREIN